MKRGAAAVSATSKAGTDGDEQRYRAPALEKGLDILELVSRASEPMSTGMITQALGRSTGELFRMIQVLEHRGFIEQVGGGYLPTTRLFALGMRQAPIKSILEVALPVMRDLAETTEQSCHLALRAAGDIVVAARMESASLIGFSVRIGYRQPLVLTGSGTVLYAFQTPETRARWETTFDPNTPSDRLTTFRARADRARANGYDEHPSDIVPGIVDLAAPVLRGEIAAAALTMPFVRKVPLKVEQGHALQLVREAARRISAELASSDVRV
jgi:DNA-binding IclR family transcriptional regulator